MIHHETPELVVFDVYDTLVSWRHSVEAIAVSKRMPVEHIYALSRDFAFATDVGKITYAEFSEAVTELLELEEPSYGERVIGGLQPIEPMLELLHDFIASGSQVALATNVGKGALHLTFERSDILPPIGSFAHIFQSCDIGLVKPDRAFFAHIEAVTGIAPHRIVFLDDNPDNVDAALNQGWGAHLVDPDNFKASADEIRRYHMPRLG